MSSRWDRGPYRAFFWPGLLIAVGLLALLVNLQLIPTDRLYRLADLWPVLLIVVGLLLLIRRSPMPASTSTVASVLVLVLAVAGAGVYVAVGPPEPGGTHQLSVRESAFGIKEARWRWTSGPQRFTSRAARRWCRTWSRHRSPTRARRRPSRSTVRPGES